MTQMAKKQNQGQVHPMRPDSEGSGLKEWWVQTTQSELALHHPGKAKVEKCRGIILGKGIEAEKGSSGMKVWPR